LTGSLLSGPNSTWTTDSVPARYRPWYID